jgi:hypothetical protein
MDANKWLRDNYKILQLKGIIDDWLKEYPDIAAKSTRQAYADSLSKRSKKNNSKLSAMATNSTVSCHRAHAIVWEIIRCALQWQTSTLLP